MSLLIVGMDVTIVNVALPAIQHDLHATLSGLQWILDAYTLLVASLLMLSGSMSDRFGRRSVFRLALFCSQPDRCCAVWRTALASL
jgi:MFS family permease